MRQGRWIDSFIFNSSASWMFGTLIFAVSSIFFFGGSDLFSAEGIALAFALGIASMYAILTALMPRSGGDYVFNSRIVHPAFGFSFNFSLTIWQLFAASFTLYFISNVALAPGLQVLGFYANVPALEQAGIWLGYPINSLIFASVANILFTIVILAGIQKTFSMLNILWGITLLGTFVMIATLFATSSDGFHSAFNSFMLTSNGTSTVTDAFSFIQSSVASPHYALAIPEIAICADSVIWVFWATYVAGEIRHANEARRNISAMAGAAVLNAAFFVILVYLLYSRVGIPFLSGLTYLAGQSSPALPFSSTLQALSAVLVLSTGNFYAALIVVLAITLGYSVLLLPALYLQPIRSIFAWSFDRVMPASWSSVSSRFNTPVLSTMGVFTAIEVGLVLITIESNFLYGLFSAVVIAPAFSSIFPTAISAIALRFKTKGRLSIFQKGLSKHYPIMLLGCASLGFIVFMTYEFVSNESFFFPAVPALSSSVLIALNFIFIPVGALIYFVSYSLRMRKSRIDLNMIMSEIPPE